MKPILIWDFDGTLGFREGMWSGTLAELAGAVHPGRPYSAGDFRPYLQSGFPWHDWAKLREPESPPEAWWTGVEPVFRHALEKGGGLSANEAAELSPKVREQYLRASAWSLFDDVPVFFSGSAASRYRHLVLSNHVPELDSILEFLGIRECFEAVFNSARTGIEKPHREAFLQILRHDPGCTSFVMIGDSYTADIAGAEDAGIPGILVRKCDPRAAYRCDTLGELEGVLETIR